MALRLSNSLQFFNNSATTLNRNTNKYVLKYNGSTGDFDLVSADTLLVTSTEDGSIPDEIVTQIEDQIDVNQLNRNYDGGSF